MKLDIKHQETYSRGELLLRTFFGWIYIGVPHFFLLYFLAIAVKMVTIFSFFAILFTGKFPKSLFEFVAQYYAWQHRVMARILNLSDGYPDFGFDIENDNVQLEVPYPETLNRWHMLLKVFFGVIYVAIPHGLILVFRALASVVLIFISWWIVLFTGKYPQKFHEFNVGTFRWALRVHLYMFLLTDDYPPFNGRP